MSLKKRMFRSNMTILLSALLSLMAIILAVLVLFEDSLERQLQSAGETRIESHAAMVAEVMDQNADKGAEALETLAVRWGYRTALVSGGEITAGDDSEEMRQLAEAVTAEAKESRMASVFSWQGATAVVRYDSGEDVVLLAAYFPEEDQEDIPWQQMFPVVLAAVAVIGLAAIGVLLFLASFFTRRMNRLVMEPVELLVEGARRIQEGNLQEEICYQGEEEFVRVCGTFNDMQRTIREDREQRARDEQARIDMVTGISHDLRTPLTSIRGYIKGVMDGVANTEEKKLLYLQTAYESTEEMNALLQKLFDFSRMESGQMPFHMVQADLAEYTAAYVAQKEAVLDPSRLRISMAFPDRLMPEISMDVEQVRRIYDNLLENSRKYAGVCPVEITVSIEETEKYLVLEWKDNGKGVEAEKLPRIFQRFYRCDESRNEKGSGVGLYVVQYIMERHHGKVTAENDSGSSGSGLKIRLYFPREA